MRRPCALNPVISIGPRVESNRGIQLVSPRRRVLQSLIPRYMRRHDGDDVPRFGEEEGGGETCHSGAEYM